MLKFIFVCLLLANGALFAYQKGYLDTFISDGREPSRAARQLNADKIKLITLDVAQPASASASASATLAAPPAALDPVVDAGKKPEPVLVACTEIGNFNEVDAGHFEKQLAALALGDRLSRRKIEEVSSRIVSIPPQGSKEGADKKANELRRMGITDFFIIKDEGETQWGISLGVYKTQAAAQARLADLNKKGVHSARSGPYSYSTSGNKVAFQLRNLDLSTKEQVDKIKEGFPQQEVRSCG